MDKLEIIAYHGWGFDRHCWQPWQELPGFGQHTFHVFDRGYFGEEYEPGFLDEAAYKVVLVHSFGLHLCNHDLFDQCDLLVILNGFLKFHPFAAQFKRRSKMALGKMIERFDDHPREVLGDFYQKVYFPSSTELEVPETLNKELLKSDLEALGNSAMDPETMKGSGKICILHGAKDAIVPKMKGRQIYDLFSERARYFEVSEAGHALPFTHRDQCWSFVKPEMNEL